jgi:hypothetical protein
LGRSLAAKKKTKSYALAHQSLTMFRYLRIAVSVVSGLCCVMLIVLWMRSYWQADCLYWNVKGHRSVFAASTGGRLVFCTGLFEMRRPGAGRFYLLNEAQIGISDIYPLAYGIPSPGRGVQSDSNSHYLVISHWLAVLMTGAAAILCIRRPDQFRFSLRTLLLATTAVALLLSLIIYAMRG